MSNALRLAAVLVAAVAVSASAQTIWTGATDTVWGDGSNWDNGTPGDAVFTGALTANLPDIGTGAGVSTLTFQSGDWVISSDDGAGGLGQLSVSLAGLGTTAVISNAGVNTIDANVLCSSYNNDGTTFQVDAGSTLVINGTFEYRRNVHFNGTGTYVFGDGFIGNKDRDTDGMANFYFNAPADVSVNKVAIGAGKTLGGTAPVMRISQYNTLTLADGGIFAPGGDGTHGADIATVMLRSTSDTIRAGFNMGGSTSQLQMDIGTALGTNDQVVVGFLTSDFNLADSVLALRGTTIEDGDYTLVSETIAGSDYTGQFGSMTFNGTPVLDDTNFSLAYNADSVVLSVTGLAGGPSVLLGDANNDGVVSADDFAAVQTNFGNTGAADGLLPGDANDDGVVSADDFAAIQTNFGNVLGAAVEAAPVPEPATMALLAVGTLAAAFRGRRRRA